MPLLLIVVLFCLINHAQALEVISFSNSNAIASINKLSQPVLSGDDFSIALGNSSSEGFDQELLMVSDDIAYIKINTNAGGFKLRVVDLKSKAVVNEIHLPESGPFQSNFFALNKQSRKLYIIGRSLDIFITRIDTLSHSIEDQSNIDIPGFYLFPTSQSQHATDIAYEPANNTLYLKDWDSANNNDKLILVNLSNNMVTFPNMPEYNSETIGRIAAIQISSNSRELFLFRSSGHIERFATTTNSFTGLMNFICTGCLENRLLNLDGTRLYTISDNTIRVYDTVLEQLLHTVPISMPEHFLNAEAIISSMYLNEELNHLLLTYSVQTDSMDPNTRHSEFMAVDVNQGQVIKGLEFDLNGSETILGTSGNNQYAYLSANYNYLKFIYVIDLRSMSYLKAINIAKTSASLDNDQIFLFNSVSLNVYSSDTFAQSAENTVLGSNSFKSRQAVGRMVAHPNLAALYVTHPYTAVFPNDFIPTNPGISPNNRLSVVNIFDNTTLTEIEVGRFPLGVVIDALGEYAYVANCGDDSLSIIDANEHKLIDTISVGEQPVAIAVNPSNAELYMTLRGENSMVVMDTGTRKIIHQIQLSAEPGNIVVTPQGDKAYIATLEGNYLLIVDLVNKQEIKSIRVSNHHYQTDMPYCLTDFVSGHPQDIAVNRFNRGLAISPDGSKVIIATPEAYEIVIIDTQNDRVQEKMSYFAISNKPIIGTSITLQRFMETLLVGKEQQSQQTQFVVNLFDHTNVVAVHNNLLPSYDDDIKQAILPEVKSDNHLHGSSYLQLVDDSNENIYQLILGQRNFGLPLAEDRVPTHDSALGEIHIPVLVVKYKDRVKHCQVRLKNLENNPLLFKVHFLDCQLQSNKTVLNDPLDITVFNIDYYLALNPDVAAHFGKNRSAVKQHWIMNGITEGRIASPVFDVRYYLETHDDIRSVFGEDYKGATQHWFSYGVTEGRKSSPVFDVAYYIAANPDIYQAFGSDFKRAIQHWVKTGINECRITSQQFQVLSYLKNNPEVDMMFNGSCPKATLHWFQQDMRDQ